MKSLTSAIPFVCILSCFLPSPLNILAENLQSEPIKIEFRLVEDDRKKDNLIFGKFEGLLAFVIDVSFLYGCVNSIFKSEILDL